MMRRTLLLLSTRTNAYVFFRQPVHLELDLKEREEALKERPYPLAEIARRMVRVRVRFDSAVDYHEKNLLRGEYKYFTGKPCDVRGASPQDMIAMLECFGHFGFWDVSLANRIQTELLKSFRHLTPGECVVLYRSLSGVKMVYSQLGEMLIKKLTELVPELSVEEVLELLDACDGESPAPLVEALLGRVGRYIEDFNPSEALIVLGVISNLSSSSPAFPEHVRVCRKILEDHLEELTVEQVAMTADTLKELNSLPPLLSKRLQDTFFALTEEKSNAGALGLMIASFKHSPRFVARVLPQIVERASELSPPELSLALLSVVSYLSTLDTRALVAYNDVRYTLNTVLLQMSQDAEAGGAYLPSSLVVDMMEQLCMLEANVRKFQQGKGLTDYPALPNLWKSLSARLISLASSTELEVCLSALKISTNSNFRGSEAVVVCLLQRCGELLGSCGPEELETAQVVLAGLEYKRQQVQKVLDDAKAVASERSVS